ncbi:uncharacterized protein [Hyperolius riggenbachi]|uniref:uncharacterized protein isoform X2 n=1 Tax=Hyperolius riggenbachi TaxID=752182 RepID=UPI0035A39145
MGPMGQEALPQHNVDIYNTGQDTISGKMDHEAEVQKILTTCPNSSEKQQEVVVPGVCSSSSEKQQDIVVPGGCPNPSEKQQEMVVPGACPSPSEKQQEVVVPGACPSPSEKQQEVVEPDGCPSSTENQQEVVVPGRCPSSSEKQQKLAVPGGCPNFTENQQEVVVLGYWPSSSDMKQEVEVLGYLPSSEMNQEMEVQGYWPSSFEVHSDCAKSSEMLHEVDASSGNARSSEMQQEVEVLGNWLSSSGDSYCVILNENEELSLLKLVETEDEPMTDVSEGTQEMVPLNVSDIQEISGMHVESNGNPISVHPCSARNGTPVASDFNNQILLYEDYMESGCSTFRKTLQELASSRELAPNFQSQPADPFGKQSITVRSQIVSPGRLVEPTNQIFLNGSCMQAGPSIKTEPMNEKLRNNRNLSCGAVVSSWDSSTDPSWNQVNMTSGNNKHDHPAVISAVPSGGDIIAQKMLDDAEWQSFSGGSLSCGLVPNYQGLSTDLPEHPNTGTCSMTVSPQQSGALLGPINQILLRGECMQSGLSINTEIENKYHPQQGTGQSHGVVIHSQGATAEPYTSQHLPPQGTSQSFGKVIHFQGPSTEPHTNKHLPPQGTTQSYGEVIHFQRASTEPHTNEHLPPQGTSQSYGEVIHFQGASAEPYTSHTVEYLPPQSTSQSYREVVCVQGVTAEAYTGHTSKYLPPRGTSQRYGEVIHSQEATAEPYTSHTSEYIAPQGTSQSYGEVIRVQGTTAEPYTSRTTENLPLQSTSQNCGGVLSLHGASTEPSISVMPSGGDTPRQMLKNIFYSQNKLHQSGAGVVEQASAGGAEHPIIQPGVVPQTPPTAEVTREYREWISKQELKARFALLKESIPAIAGLQRAPRTLILQYAIAYIRMLQETRRQLQEEINRLEVMNQILQDRMWDFLIDFLPHQRAQF